MKLLPLLLFSLIFGTGIQAATLGGAIEFTPASGWIQVDARGPGKSPPPLPTIRFVPKDGRNASVLLTLFPAEFSKVRDLASLKKFHRMACTPYVPSADAKVEFKEFGTPHGVGVYSTFEDPDLIGKPPIKDNFKFTAPVSLYLHDGATIQATIFTDSMATADFQQALQIIKSAVASPKPPAAAAPSVQGTNIEISLMPRLHAVLRLPKAGFQKFDPMPSANPGHFSFAGENGLMLSGWLDRSSSFPGMRKFWVGEKAALENKAGFKVSDDNFKKVGEWEVVIYTISMGEKMTQKNLRACRVVGDTWADLHLSLSSPDSTWEGLENALKSVVFVAVTPEAK